MNILALDLGGTNIKSGIILSDGSLTEAREQPSEGNISGKRLMDNALSVASSYSNYDRIGISTTGQVNSKEGRIIFANDNVPGYTGMDVKGYFEYNLGIQTKVLNDVHAAGLGEAHFGGGREFDDFLLLTYGTGVGGAIIFNRNVYKGGFGAAGEFGHMVVHPGGRNCSCGQEGCYEQYASTRALVQKAYEYKPCYIDGRTIFEGRDSWSEEMKGLVSEWIDEVILGLRSLIHIFNSSCIILGGGVMQQSWIIEEIRSRLPRYINMGHRGVRIMGAKLGNTAGLFGVASLFL